MARDRESCAVMDKFRGRAGWGVEGATVVITAAPPHRLSFIRPDKLLKELLTDCCWCAARKQPSASVRDSATLLSSAKGGGRGSERRAAAVEAAVDGSLGFLGVDAPRGGTVVYHGAFGAIIIISVRARTGGSDAAATRLLLVILGELSPMLTERMEA